MGKVSSFVTRSNPEASIRLFAFPYAGAGRSAYSELADACSSNIEWVEFELPGRGVLYNEPAYTEFDSLITDLADLLAEKTGDMPFAFFGHSFGALLAFETCRELRRRNNETPIMLFLSGRRSPECLARSAESGVYIYDQTDQNFISSVRAWGVLRESALADSSLLDIVLPPLKSDIRLDETYRLARADDLPMDVPAIIYSGNEDPSVSSAELQGWGQFFSRTAVTMEYFDGDHFYIYDSTGPLVSSIEKHIQSQVLGCGTSILWTPPSSYLCSRENFKSVADLFRLQVSKTPAALALEDGDRSWSYEELATLCNHVSLQLVRSGVVEGSTVGLFLGHRAEYLIAMLACLQVGATVCLLEVSWSDSLLAEFVEACDVSLIVSEGELAKRVQDNGPLFVMDEALLEEALSSPKDYTVVRCLPEAIAIISMTSGSTGRPKAVLTTQQGCTYCFLARGELYPYAAEGEREGLNVFFAWECLRPLLFGQVAVVIPDSVIFDPPRLQSFIEKNRVSRLVVTPSLLANLLENPIATKQLDKHWSSVRLCFLMGEVVSGMLVEKARRIFPVHARLINAYSTWESLDVGYSDLFVGGGCTRLWAPVGQPLPGSAVILLDENGHCVPWGMPGELYLAGPGIAPGYLADDQKTAERFLPLAAELSRLPLSDKRMYRTGDRARLLQNGQLLILGRMDNTVKIRGFKVSLLAVERVFNEMEGVSKSVVLPLMDERSGQPQGLLAYIVGTGGIPSELLLAKARRQARSRLPEYAQPSHIIGLAELPMRQGESRKLDLQALPRPIKTEPEPLERVNLLVMEQRVADIWCEVLGINNVQPADNFFDVGGSSLSAANLVSVLTERLGISLTVVDIYQHSTLQEFVEWQQGGQAKKKEQRPRRREATTSIAVVGIAGRFPGADSIEEFWSNLQQGNDSLRHFTHEELRAKGVPDEVFTHPAWVAAGQVLNDADKFDALFWGIGQREATLMDPQHRLFMEVAWAAMEQAGYARVNNPYRERTAVYAACGMDGYLIHHLQGGGLKEPLDPGKLFLTEIGNEKDYIATRVSFQLDLGGPGVTVTSACSSGLLAVAQAAQSLMMGQCDMAIAGASSLNFPNFGYCFEEGLVGSVDGRVHPFDEDASGTLFGDSVGAVVLKRLDDAQADGDMIWAVLSGYGMSNDGRQKAGYAAPNAVAQTRCIVDAMQMAGVAAEQLSYVECHATATHIGDAIELKGLRDAFEATRKTQQVTPRSCAIGSVKGNIGHANCAAGITGFIKTALCLHHRQLVPTVNFHEHNAKLVDLLDHPASPFYVNQELVDWPETETGEPLRTGVSSFGIGGTNVHVILEQAPARPDEIQRSDSASFCRQRHLLCISARSVGALANNLEKLSQVLDDASAEHIAQAAFTLHLAREAHSLRLAVSVAADGQDLGANMRAALGSERRVKAGHKATVALCFSGQGSQHVGMARQLYNGTADGGYFRGHFEEVCQALTGPLGFNPLALILGADAAEMQRPVVTQCGLFAVEYAMASSLIELGIRPVAVAGHSIGEYAAAVVAGVLTLEDAALLVATRALATEALRLTDIQGRPVSGGMLSVAGDETVFHDWLALHPELWLAVHNLPGQWVLAGLLPNLESAEQALDELGLRCTRVPVSHPFHSALMSPVAGRLHEAAKVIKASLPRIPMTSNVSGTWLGDEVLESGYWGQHLLATVRWAEDLETLLRWQPDIILEIGPSNVLTGLAGRFLSLRNEDTNVAPTLLASMRHPRTEIDDEQVFCELLGRLWCAGVDLDWEAYHRHEQAGPSNPLRRIPLPSYAFERDSFWLNPQASIYVDAPASRPCVEKTSQVSAAAAASSWLVRLVPPRQTATLRLYCFSYAGGNSRHFKDWANKAPDWLDLVAVELPGRNGRMEEPLANDEQKDAELRQALAQAIRRDSAGQPFAFCGLSYGAALASELLAQELSDLDQDGECSGLIVVGRAPVFSTPNNGREIDSEAFLMVPEATRSNPLWREWYLPILLADLESDQRTAMRMSTLWQQRGGRPLLRCELMLHCGSQDPACSVSEAQDWFALSSAMPGEVAQYPGEHDFMLREEALIFSRMLDWLQQRRPRQAPPDAGTRLFNLQWQPLAPISARPDDAGTHCWELNVGQELKLLEPLCDCLNSDSANAVLLCLGKPQSDGYEQYQGFMSLLQQLLLRDVRGRLTLLLPASQSSGPLAGLARVAGNESSALCVQNLFASNHPDLSRTQPQAHWLAHQASLANAYPQERELLWRNSCLLAARLLPNGQVPLPPGVLGASGSSYLITGGSGALGQALVNWLIDRQAVEPSHIVIICRSLPTTPPRGVRCIACDLTQPQALDKALHGLERMSGIFHLAGVLDDGALSNLDDVRLHRVLAPKLALADLLKYSRGWGCDWVIGYSSTSALLGAMGQGNYAAANAWIDQLADWPRECSRTRVVSLAWGTWGDMGMAAGNRKVLQRAHAVGETPLSTQAALDALAAVLSHMLGGGAGNRFVVCEMDWQRSPWARWSLLEHVRQPVLAPMNTVVHEPSLHEEPCPLESLAVEDSGDFVRRFLGDYISRWDESLDLTSLGLDSLDLAQLRNGFNKRFGTQLPLSIFAAPNLTLGQLWLQLQTLAKNTAVIS